jgi:hypothetical protein
MEQAVIDRFEGEIAVLLIGETQRQLDVPRSQLPPEAREGQWLRVEIHGSQVMRVEIDAQASEAAQARIQEKLERLRRGDHLRQDD